MQLRHGENQVRYTHKPTGTSVVVRYHRLREAPWADRHARAILKAKLFRPVEPPNPTRTYTFAPAYAAGIRQGGERIVEGYDGLLEVLDGRSSVLPRPPEPRP